MYCNNNVWLQHNLTAHLDTCCYPLLYHSNAQKLSQHDHLNNVCPISKNIINSWSSAQIWSVLLGELSRSRLSDVWERNWLNELSHEQILKDIMEAGATLLLLLFSLLSPASTLSFYGDSISFTPLKKQSDGTIKVHTHSYTSYFVKQDLFCLIWCCLKKNSAWERAKDVSLTQEEMLLQK